MVGGMLNEWKEVRESEEGLEQWEMVLGEREGGLWMGLFLVGVECWGFRRGKC